jgi:hypothetical protein
MRKEGLSHRPTNYCCLLLSPTYTLHYAHMPLLYAQVIPFPPTSALCMSRLTHRLPLQQRLLMLLLPAAVTHLHAAHCTQALAVCTVVAVDAFLVQRALADLALGHLARGVRGVPVGRV